MPFMSPIPFSCPSPFSLLLAGGALAREAKRAMGTRMHRSLIPDLGIMIWLGKMLNVDRFADVGSHIV